MSGTSRDRPDHDRPDEDVDAAFARIIAGWDEVPAMPDAEGPASATGPAGTGSTPSGAPPTSESTGGPASGATPVMPTAPRPPLPPAPIEPAAFLTGPRDHQPPEVEEGYVPPEPPPLPRGDLLTALPWVAVVVGPLILVLAGLFWRTASPWWLGLAVISFVGGFVALVMRLPLHHDDDEGDGAVV